ncbi:MAG TPA: hypothetical protein VLD39_06405, partial [Gammaproteobacteria bacterium]|nr:hypothetical protein [Gammaproteobacteria bacterium]
MHAAATSATPVPAGPARRHRAATGRNAGCGGPTTAARAARARPARHAFALGAAIACFGLLAATARAASGPDAAAPPALLSATGLYVEGSTSEIRPDLLPFSPQYPL